MGAIEYGAAWTCGCASAWAFSPGYGLFGRSIVNVLQMNLALRKRYGVPS